MEAGSDGHGDAFIETPRLVDRLFGSFRDWQFETNMQTELDPPRVCDNVIFHKPTKKINNFDYISQRPVFF